MDLYEKQLKRKLNVARVNGAVTAAIGVATIFLYFFNILNPWVCVILLCYCMAMSFFQNSTFQEVRAGRVYGVINICFAALFFVMTVFIIVYSFVTKGIRF